MVCVPSTSVSKNTELSLMLRGTCVSAARWTTASQPASTDSTICGLRTLPCTKSTRSAASTRQVRFSRLPA